jgi:hypothetical protein
MNYFAVLMIFLRDRTAFLEEIHQQKKLQTKIISLLISSSVFFAIYGAIMGAYGGGLQMFASAIKLPALYLLTLIICLPTLFFFDVIAGSKRTFPQYLALLLASMAIISVMLFGFAPITLFFLLSIHNYRFFILLNIIILAITGYIGVRFFYQSMLSFMVEDARSPSSQFNSRVLKAWLFLYMFVGSQLGWTLRPFFGYPDLPFTLFRSIESNFYIELMKLISRLLGMGSY